jgi:GNAT superfamily N-acetyltransferase
VTLADEMEPARIGAAVESLAGYSATVTFERVHLLEESKTAAGRVWRPIADAPFAPPAVVGRGGIELELTASAGGDEEVRAFADREWYAHGVDVLGPDFPPEEPFTIVARRDGGVAYLRELIVDRNQRSQGIGSRLLAAFESLAAERATHHLALRTWTDSRSYGFYKDRGWVDDVSWTWKHGREFVQMRRDH